VNRIIPLTSSRAARIGAIAAQIKYEDFVLEVDGDWLCWHYPARDVYSGEMKMWEARPWSCRHLSDETLEREIVTTAFLGIRTILEHEARELFRYGGRHPFAPHSRPFNG
jgi:hypothetical protein